MLLCYLPSESKFLSQSISFSEWKMTNNKHLISSQSRSNLFNLIDKYRDYLYTFFPLSCNILEAILAVIRQKWEGWERWEL